jgi:UDP-2,3-diacylglucosamine hydrolase
MLKAKATTIGLVAGNGQYPLIFAREALKRGHRVVAVGVREETDASLEGMVDRFHWVQVGELGRLLDFLKQEGVKDLVMAGQIQHQRLFQNHKPDSVLSKMLNRVKDRRADTLLKAVAWHLGRIGIRLRDSRMFLDEMLPKRGVLTKTVPSVEEEQDIRFGFKLAKRVSALDIGQSVAVKGRAIIAVEAMEGTDNMIRRASSIAGKGVVIVKVSKVKQDMRFDVPCIGSKTVQILAESQSGPLVIEAGKTLILEKEQVIQEANEKGVAIVAA